MSLSYKKFLVLYVLTIGLNYCLHAQETIEIFQDRMHRTIELRRILDAELFSQAAPIFAAAFLKAYEKLTDQDLKLIKPLTRKERIDRCFQNEELLNFNEHKFFVVGAFFDNQLIGYISFDQPTEGGELYLRQLVLDPSYWGNGIGKTLVFSTLQIFPHTTCLALVTRRNNECARDFYQHLGFAQCEQYVHAPWDPKEFIGYKKMTHTIVSPYLVCKSLP